MSVAKVLECMDDPRAEETKPDLEATVFTSKTLVDLEIALQTQIDKLASASRHKWDVPFHNVVQALKAAFRPAGMGMQEGWADRSRDAVRHFCLMLHACGINMLQCRQKLEEAGVVTYNPEGKPTVDITRAMPLFKEEERRAVKEHVQGFYKEAFAIGANAWGIGMVTLAAVVEEQPDDPLARWKVGQDLMAVMVTAASSAVHGGQAELAWRMLWASLDLSLKRYKPRRRLRGGIVEEDDGDEEPKEDDSEERFRPRSLHIGLAPFNPFVLPLLMVLAQAIMSLGGPERTGNVVVRLLRAVLFAAERVLRPYDLLLAEELESLGAACLRSARGYGKIHQLKEAAARLQAALCIREPHEFRLQRQYEQKKQEAAKKALEEEEAARAAAALPYNFPGPRELGKERPKRAHWCREKDCLELPCHPDFLCMQHGGGRCQYKWWDESVADKCERQHLGSPNINGEFLCREHSIETGALPQPSSGGAAVPTPPPQPQQQPARPAEEPFVLPPALAVSIATAYTHLNDFEMAMARHVKTRRFYRAWQLRKQSAQAYLGAARRKLPKTISSQHYLVRGIAAGFSCMERLDAHVEVFERMEWWGAPDGGRVSIGLDEAEHTLVKRLLLWPERYDKLILRRMMKRGGEAVVLEGRCEGKLVAAKLPFQKETVEREVRARDHIAKLGTSRGDPTPSRWLAFVEKEFTDPWPCLVMKYEERAVDLLALVRRKEPVPLRSVLTILEELSRALAVMHRCGVAHGDVAPRNVLVRENKTVCVIDLGLSKVVQVNPPSLEAKMAFAEDVLGVGRIMRRMLQQCRAAEPLKHVWEACLHDEPGQRPEMDDVWLVVKHHTFGYLGKLDDPCEFGLQRPDGGEDRTQRVH